MTTAKKPTKKLTKRPAKKSVKKPAKKKPGSEVPSRPSASVREVAHVKSVVDACLKGCARAKLTRAAAEGTRVAVVITVPGEGSDTWSSTRHFDPSTITDDEVKMWVGRVEGLVDNIVDAIAS